MYLNERSEWRKLLYQRLRGALAGLVAGGEGELEVVAARVGVDVQHLAGEVEAGDFAGLEALRYDGARVDAAVGDDGALEADEAFDLELPVLQRTGERVDGHVRVAAEERQREAPGQKLAEENAEEALEGDAAAAGIVLDFLPAGMDVLVEALQLHGGLEVDGDGDFLAVHDGLDGAAADHETEGPLETAVGEFEIAEFALNLLAVNE